MSNYAQNFAVLLIAVFLAVVVKSHKFITVYQESSISRIYNCDCLVGYVTCQGEHADEMTLGIWTKTISFYECKCEEDLNCTRHYSQTKAATLDTQQAGKHSLSSRVPSLGECGFLIDDVTCSTSGNQSNGTLHLVDRGETSHKSVNTNKTFHCMDIGSTNCSSCMDMEHIKRHCSDTGLSAVPTLRKVHNLRKRSANISTIASTTEDSTLSTTITATGNATDAASQNVSVESTSASDKSDTSSTPTPTPSYTTSKLTTTTNNTAINCSITSTINCTTNNTANNCSITFTINCTTNNTANNCSITSTINCTTNNTANNCSITSTINCTTNNTANNCSITSTINCTTNNTANNCSITSTINCTTNNTANNCSITSTINCTTNNTATNCSITSTTNCTTNITTNDHSNTPTTNSTTEHSSAEASPNDESERTGLIVVCVIVGLSIITGIGVCTFIITQRRKTTLNYKRQQKDLQKQLAAIHKLNHDNHNTEVKVLETVW